MKISSSIGTLNGIGPKTETILQKLGVYTIGDILLAFPRDYKSLPHVCSIRDIEGEREYAFKVDLCGTPAVKRTRSIPVTFANAADATGRIQALWFRMPYIKNQLIEMQEFVLYGKVSCKNGHYEMEQPQIYKPEAYQAMLDTLQPVYTLTKGISSKQFGRFVHSALDGLSEDVEYLEEEIRIRNDLMPLKEALTLIHFPEHRELLGRARKRLAFDEFFLFLLQMQQLKENTEQVKNSFPAAKDAFIEKQIEKLPFPLTGAQQKVMQEIEQDICGDVMMQRLVQGDVGSGKTILAYLSMCKMAESGYQSAIMVPTEVLARQHYDTFTAWMEEFGLDYPVILLTGSLSAAQKREVYKRIECEPDALIVGTHALIQEKAVYHNLSLVVTDEQHRFGVRQRETFADKGMHQPHVLVMSATPIPRTLAMILYGDLALSVIDELPARRLAVKNCVVQERMRAKSWQFIAEEAAKGHQAYVICPLVEENEELELEDVISYTDKLRKYFAGKVRVEYLHGKMKNPVKNQIMEDFLKNEIQVLVSTTVVEVGVNVPNATVMMIENAQRFGLAQLHQLRGRVGRGTAQSYCIMVNTSPAKQAKERLDILNHSNDGFFIAEEDLKLRGPGDFFGIRQSGDMEFRIADIFSDAGILAQAAKEAGKYCEADRADAYEKAKKIEQIRNNSCISFTERTTI